MSVSLVRDIGRRPLYFISQIQDINGRKQAEESLKMLNLHALGQKAVLENVLDHIPCAVFWKDRRSVYLGCNVQHARDIGRLTSEEVVGKATLEFVRSVSGNSDVQLVEVGVSGACKPQQRLGERMRGRAQELQEAVEHRIGLLV